MSGDPSSSARLTSASAWCLRAWDGPCPGADRRCKQRDDVDAATAIERRRLEFGKHAGLVPHQVHGLVPGQHAFRQLAAINSVYAGDPVTFTYTAGTAFAVSGIQQDFRGANIYRPNLVGDPMAPEGQRSITNWFNKDAVVIPTDPSQPFGNAPRNNVRGPLVWQIDMALSKNVTLPWRASQLELRLEVFNLMNRANFRAPNGNRSAAGFGTITSTYDPRQLQLGVKVRF